MQLPRKSKWQNAEPALRASLAAEIAQRGGALPFADYMATALYHPEHGYYSSGRARVGRGGDYFTSVSVGPVFGRLLAAQFADIWELLERPTDFTIVEQGAHDGAFAHDALRAAAQEWPEFFAALRYRIVEPFAVLRARQQTRLRELASKITWQETLEEPFRGVHFSNELLDAFPVHLVRWTGTEWRERGVDAAGEFVDLPLTNAALAARLELIPQPLPAGYETEVNLAALRWIESLSKILTQGVVLVADYGFPRADFYAPHRTRGTLQSYAGHKVLPDPLAHPGRADLTAHVEWTSLAEQALAHGCALAGFTDQHHFLTGLLDEKVASDPALTRGLQTLLHPGFLGMKFQFLALAKNFPAAPRLRGLRFARNAEAALGLANESPVP